MANLREAKHWIDGEWSAAGTRRESINPATGEVIGHYADGNVETAQAAINAAQAAFETGHWRDDPFMRATALCRLADAYEARMGEIVETLATENGKMKYEAGFEAHFIPRALRFAAGLAMHNFGHVAEVKPGVQSMSIREPVGVAGLIIPWNSPAYLSIRSLVPALAAGCTAAVKMPHVAAQVSQLMSEIIASVNEIPKGVVNIFIELGADSHMGPLIDKAAVARVNACVDAAIAVGAKPLVRGGLSKDPKLAVGASYHPTLLEVTDSTLPIVREETFGPVQTLQVFDTEEEAIRMANDSEYGLSACVWSRDIDRPIPWRASCKPAWSRLTAGPTWRLNSEKAASRPAALTGPCVDACTAISVLIYCLHEANCLRRGLAQAIARVSRGRET